MINLNLPISISVKDVDHNIFSLEFYGKLIYPYIKRTQEFGYNDNLSSIICHYNEPHRYFHTTNHLCEILTLIDYLESNKIITDEDLIFNLKCVAYFHDVIYDPKSQTNEKQSAEFFLKCIQDWSEIEDIKKHTELSRIMSIYQAIECTKNHIDINELTDIFNQLDFYTLTHRSFSDLMIYEDQIMKEFQFYSYDQYKEGRLKFLYTVNYTLNRPELFMLCDYIEHRKINIGIYAGSFKPFHIGHMDIFKKAELIFDKVIIVRGKNLEKDPNSEFNTDLEKLFPYHEIRVMDRYLYDFVDSISQYSNATLVKGLRNSQDFDYEFKQQRYNQLIFKNRLEENKNITPKIMNTVYLMSEPEFSHISSSDIRLMEKYEKGSAEKLISKRYENYTGNDLD